MHVWNADRDRYPLMAGANSEAIRPRTFLPEELFGHCRPAGVARVVLIQMSFYGYDNRYMLEVMAAHPGVFSGVAVIDDRAAAPDVTMREYKAQGVRGFRLRPRDRNVDYGAWLGSAGMQSMFRCGAEEGLAMCFLVEPDALDSIGNMCQTFPDTPVVIDHLARIGVDGTIRDEDVDRLCHLAQHENVTVKVSAFYALGAKKPPHHDLAPMIRRVFGAFGPERLMWASDCPFQVDPGHTYLESIDLIRSGLGFLTASDREWLLRRTAERVFFNR